MAVVQVLQLELKLAVVHSLSLKGKLPFASTYPYQI